MNQDCKEEIKVIKLWKKGIALTMAAAMAVSLTACGGGNSSSGGSKEAGNTPAADAGGKLNVAIWDNGQKPGLDQILADFTKETGIETDLQVITWDSYWTLLEVSSSCPM